MEDKLIDNVKGESQPHPESRRVTLPSASAPQAEEPSVSGVSYRRSHTAPLLSTSDQETYKGLYKDIESLKNIDFIKTYSRLRRPQGLKTMSTTTSPIGSPTLISPTADTGNVGISSGRRLNRSLSLKLLTERLKSGRPPTEASSCKPSTRETPTRDFSQTSAFGTLRRVFPKKSRNMSELVTTRPDTPHATDPKVTSETEEGDAKEQSSDKSTVIDSDGDKRQQSNTTEEGRESPLCEAQPEDISHKEEEDKKTFVSSCVLGMPQTKDTKSTGNTDDSSEKVTKKGGDLSEDEGVESGDQTSVKSVDSKVPASQRPQRRSGAASLAMSGKVQEMFANLAAGDENQGDSGKQDEQTPRRISRRTENGVSGTGQKTSSLRFVTHPPQTKTSVHEGGSVDSNGLGSLKAQERAFPSDPSKLGPQESNLSLTDSHISGADSDFDSSYSEVVQGATSDGSDPDKFEKRNGKSLKQKSKSDPSGAKARDGVELPDSPKSSHTQSAPDIGEEKRESSGLPEFKVTEDEAKCRSEDVLSKHGTEVSPERETETPTSYTVSHDPLTSGRESGNDPGDSLSPRELHTRYGGYSHSPSPSRTDSGRPKRRYASPSSTKSPSAPSHDRSYPFTEKNHPYTLLLSVPPPRKPILRSASSASVLQRDRRGYYSPAPSYIKDTEPVRKYSATTDEPPSASALRSGTSVPEFPPSIGDSVGALATSMPDVWQQTPPPMTPETDIPYQFFKDKRYHIVEELYRNEKEYVDALKTLKDKYMSPLKSQNVLDESVVDHIFYMVPEILIHHSIYLDFLDKVWKNWDSRNSTVGNIIVSIFSKQTVLDSYLSFVENYKSSGKVIESALLTKSSVSKFLDLCQRESGSKLTIKDLIVRPIQRIPRYELLLQRLIENTPKNHPDAPLLQEAEKVMHDLAVKIGTATESKQEEDMQETLKKLEMLLVTELNAPDRTYLRHDMVQISNKKDMCCVWLFSDVLIISSVKRKSGPVTRKVSIILKTPYGQDYAENIKHKTWLRVGLDDIEILKSSLSRWPTFDKEQVEDDLVLLNQMNELCTQLQCNHQMLDEALKDLMSSLNDQLSDYQTRNPSSESNKLELLVTTQEGVLHLLVIFASPEKRAVWEATFSDAKLKLSLLSDKRAPEFLQPLQITKTRAGMQFSCAAPIDGLNANGYRDVWVCNSDGYVGHMCLLSLQPEPIVTLNTPVPGCNARILCICAVPAFNGPFRRKGSNKSYRQRTTSGRVSPHVTIECPETASYGGDEDGYQSDSESSDDDPIAFKANREDDTLLKESEPLPSPVTSEPMTTTGSWTQDPHKSTMWLGTEDGCIHIFQCTDNIKTTKNKLKIQHGASVYCIVYLDNKVFLSLANGIVVVYRRDQDGFWVTDAPIIRCLGSANAPITKMLAVAGKMWCGCQQNIFVVNPGTLKTECSFTVTPESSVQCLVTSGQGVWIACQQSARVLLYHATSYEYLLEVSVAQAVSQKLQSADDIIRQHKAACLRITALLICKDLLWVGTSAGVILTIPIPKITSTTTRGTLTVPAVTGLVYGHTGHVRFLTTIEMPTTSSQKLEINSSDEQANENLSLSDIQRRASMATPATMATRMLIISGGDGYEDFRNNASNEAAGRDDSTNHLLLWQV